jgi:hypothetical protein
LKRSWLRTVLRLRHYYLWDSKVELIDSIRVWREGSSCGAGSYRHSVYPFESAVDTCTGARAAFTASLLRECHDYPIEAGTGTRLTLVGHT